MEWVNGMAGSMGMRRSYLLNTCRWNRPLPVLQVTVDEEDNATGTRAHQRWTGQ